MLCGSRICQQRGISSKRSVARHEAAQLRGPPGNGLGGQHALRCVNLAERPANGGAGPKKKSISISGTWLKRESAGHQADLIGPAGNVNGTAGAQDDALNQEVQCIS